ncbi:MAG: hypothetical protein LBQ50_11110 [Planctomycetaceae bacterium]|nr:hypothetical protein [Planctomycetaceae bacterium]
MFPTNSPDERLIVCYNPLLEKRRKNQREELLVATEKLLTDLAQRILKRHDRGKPYSEVEKSFRTIKTTMLDIRPIHHHLENRVRAHFLICMLSYYVVWHLRRAWSKYLFSNKNTNETRASRNPVLTATPAENVKNKKTRKPRENSNDQPAESATIYQTQSFRTLLNRLATICLTQCQIKNENENVCFNKITIPDNFQNELIKQIKQINTTTDSN